MILKIIMMINSGIKLVSVTPMRNWSQLLPDTKDLQEHAAEIKVDGLPQGDICLSLLPRKDFNPKTGILGARFFYVSNISYSAMAEIILY